MYERTCIWMYVCTRLPNDFITYYIHCIGSPDVACCVLLLFLSARLAVRLSRNLPLPVLTTLPPSSINNITLVYRGASLFISIRTLHGPISLTSS